MDDVHLFADLHDGDARSHLLHPRVLQGLPGLGRQAGVRAEPGPRDRQHKDQGSGHFWHSFDDFYHVKLFAANVFRHVT